MAHCASATSSSRTTLPPLRTLLENLKMIDENAVLPSLERMYDPHETNREKAHFHCPPVSSLVRQRRQVSARPITTSRTPSLVSTCTPSSLPYLDSQKLPYPPQKIRLVPATLENADAVVVIPPPLPASQGRQPQPLLLMGPALQRFRQPNRRLAKGARVHPYQIVRGVTEPHGHRRPPMTPTNTNTN
ncbi:hypothetical protein EDD16DRAFT_554826 [Pisolithus croceorrhizus]|nr:hypothetical protein F5141DRAFT_1212813 [Pisolithus sp. B1]KAI6124548.1 hypothetical protein EDD16DRAFT_554826 [Pisolithus croceorrhizus]KAI6129562.1 hypothetical protein EV401DRAFT_748688 [Pisolithus croceorrhizus]